MINSILEFENDFMFNRLRYNKFQGTEKKVWFIENLFYQKHKSTKLVLTRYKKNSKFRFY